MDKTIEQQLPRPHVSDLVIYHDAKGIAHNALIKCAWDQDSMIDQPCINLTYVSGDVNRQDNGGRQTIVETSVVHKGYSGGTAHGMYWRWPNEDPVEYRAPSDV